MWSSSASGVIRAGSAVGLHMEKVIVQLVCSGHVMGGLAPFVVVCREVVEER